jgi:hypothetical protein
MVGGVVLFFVMSISSLSQAGEPTLSVEAASTSKQIATVKLENEIPVMGMQFTLTGAKITEIRTTDRTKSFLAKFNEQNGKVIILSTTGDRVAPGKGAVAEIVCDKPGSAVLSEVKIVGN